MFKEKGPIVYGLATSVFSFFFMKGIFYNKKTTKKLDFLKEIESSNQNTSSYTDTNDILWKIESFDNNKWYANIKTSAVTEYPETSFDAPSRFELIDKIEDMIKSSVKVNDTYERARKAAIKDVEESIVNYNIIQNSWFKSSKAQVVTDRFDENETTLWKYVYRKEYTKYLNKQGYQSDEDGNMYKR